jgi:hypothetical protein
MHSNSKIGSQELYFDSLMVYSCPGLLKLITIIQNIADICLSASICSYSSRVRTFIIDDSVLRRDRSKKAELLARVFDHTTGRYARGYNMLTLGWSDGFSFAPIDFVMLSSAKLYVNSSNGLRVCPIISRLCSEN